MKMRDIVLIMLKNKNISISSASHSGYNCYYINLENKTKIKNLIELPCFKDFYNLIGNIFLKNSSEYFQISNKEVENAYYYLQEVLKACNLYISCFNSFYPEISDNSISFKFKDTNDLASLAKIMKEIDFILNQLFSGTNLDSKFELTNFDQGSKWLDIVIEKKEAFLCFAEILNFIFSAGKDLQEIRLRETQIEKTKLEMKLTEEQIKLYKNINEQHYKMKLKSQAEIIKSKHYPNSEDSELAMRIFVAMENLSDLYIDNNYIRPTDLIAYNIPNGDLNPWGYIEEVENKKIEYKKEETLEK